MHASPPHTHTAHTSPPCRPFPWVISSPVAAQRPMRPPCPHAASRPPSTRQMPRPWWRTVMLLLPRPRLPAPSLAFHGNHHVCVCTESIMYVCVRKPSCICVRGVCFTETIMYVCVRKPSCICLRGVCFTETIVYVCVRKPSYICVRGVCFTETIMYMCAWGVFHGNHHVCVWGGCFTETIMYVCVGCFCVLGFFFHRVFKL